MEGEMIMLQNLYEFEFERVKADKTIVGTLRPTGLRPSFVRKFRQRGIEVEPGLFGTEVDAMFGNRRDEAAQAARDGAHR
jgi:pilus assembly protein CpaF